MGASIASSIKSLEWFLCREDFKRSLFEIDKIGLKKNLENEVGILAKTVADLEEEELEISAQIASIDTGAAAKSLGLRGPYLRNDIEQGENGHYFFSSIPIAEGEISVCQKEGSSALLALLGSEKPVPKRMSFGNLLQTAYVLKVSEVQFQKHAEQMRNLNEKRRKIQDLKRQTLNRLIAKKAQSKFVNGYASADVVGDFSFFKFDNSEIVLNRKEKTVILKDEQNSGLVLCDKVEVTPVRSIELGPLRPGERRDEKVKQFVKDLKSLLTEQKRAPFTDQERSVLRASFLVNQDNFKKNEIIFEKFTGSGFSEKQAEAIVQKRLLEAERKFEEFLLEPTYEQYKKFFPGTFGNSAYHAKFEKEGDYLVIKFTVHRDGESGPLVDFFPGHQGTLRIHQSMAGNLKTQGTGIILNSMKKSDFERLLME